MSRVLADTTLRREANAAATSHAPAQRACDTGSRRSASSASALSRRDRGLALPPVRLRGRRACFVRSQGGVLNHAVSAAVLGRGLALRCQRRMSISCSAVSAVAVHRTTSCRAVRHSRTSTRGASSREPRIGDVSLSRDRSGRMCVVGPIVAAQGLWSARGRSRSSGDGSIHAPPVALDAGARSDDLLSQAALDRRVRDRRPRIPDLQLRVHVTRRHRRRRTDENLQDGGARPTVLTPAFQPHPTMHLGKALRLGRARTLDPCDNLGVR